MVKGKQQRKIIPVMCSNTDLGRWWRRTSQERESSLRLGRKLYALSYRPSTNPGSIRCLSHTKFHGTSITGRPAQTSSPTCIQPAQYHSCSNAVTDESPESVTKRFALSHRLSANSINHFLWPANRFSSPFRKKKRLLYNKTVFRSSLRPNFDARCTKRISLS